MKSIATRGAFHPIDGAARMLAHLLERRPTLLAPSAKLVVVAPARAGRGGGSPGCRSYGGARSRSLRHANAVQQGRVRAPPPPPPPPFRFEGADVLILYGRRPLVFPAATMADALKSAARGGRPRAAVVLGFRRWIPPLMARIIVAWRRDREDGRSIRTRPSE